MEKIDTIKKSIAFNIKLINRRANIIGGLDIFLLTYDKTHT